MISLHEHDDDLEDDFADEAEYGMSSHMKDEEEDEEFSLMPVSGKLEDPDDSCRSIPALYRPPFPRDPFYGLLFWFHIVLTVLIVRYTTPTIETSKALWWGSFGSMGCSVVYSLTWLYYTIGRHAPASRLVLIATLVSIGSIGALSLLCLASHTLSGLILGLVALIWFSVQLLERFRPRRSSNRHRVQFEFIMTLLELSYAFCQVHPSVVVVVSMGFGLYLGWVSWWSSVVMANRDCVWTLMWLAGHFVWTSRVMTDVVKFILSGMVVWSYYHPLHTRDTRDRSPNLPSSRKATGHFIRCAGTTSFGSLCLGAIVGPTQVLVYDLRQTWGRVITPDSNHPPPTPLRVHYSVAHIAAYGKSFWASSRDTWSLIQHEDMTEILVTNHHATRALFQLLIMGSLGLSCLVFASCYVMTEHWMFVLCLYGLVSATVVVFETQVLTEFIRSLFVCFVENPQRFSRVYPIIYHRLIRLRELNTFTLRSSSPQSR